MSHNFLIHLLSVAQEVTQADRGLVVDQNREVVERHNIDDDTFNNKSFKSFVDQLINQAMDTNRTIITNNIITDPSQAPNTNTNFSDLRIVIVIPVEDYGAVYLDQPIRIGIIQRDIIDRINQMIQKIKQENMENTEKEYMLNVYEKLL